MVLFSWMHEKSKIMPECNILRLSLSSNVLQRQSYLCSRHALSWTCTHTFTTMSFRCHSVPSVVLTPVPPEAVAWFDLLFSAKLLWSVLLPVPKSISVLKMHGMTISYGGPSMSAQEEFWCNIKPSKCFGCHFHATISHISDTTVMGSVTTCV